MAKCDAHDKITADVASTKTEITNIKDSIGVLFKKIDKLTTANVLMIILLLIAIGEKVLPFVSKLAFAGE